MILDQKSVTEALKARCGLCKAKPGDPCVNPCTGEPMGDRRVHFYRIEPK